jgi:hypothetical protein
MFGFPISNGNSGLNDFVENFLPTRVGSFPSPKTKEVFYSVKDGNWNDSTVWQTASGRVGLFPTINDDVYIKHTVTLNGNHNVNNFFVSGILTTDTSARTLSVHGNINSIGTINLSTNNVGHVLNLGGTNNVINNLIAGTASTVQYFRNGDQNILPLQYRNLTVQGSGTKYLIDNTIVNGNLSCGTGGFLECGFYDLSVFGNTSVPNTSANGIGKTHFGNLLFVGNVNIGNSTTPTLNLTGNPNVECRGGVNFDPGGNINVGAGTWTFSTNNQTISVQGRSFNNVLISGAITVSVSNSIAIYGSINGNNALSRLFMNVSSTLSLTTQTAAETSLTTGTWDFTTNSNTVAFAGNYSATIPSYFTTFRNLTTSGTGTKTLSTNTIVSGSLTINTNGGLLNCSIHDLTVNGSTLFQNGGLQKTGAGNLLFIGNFQSVVAYNTNKIDFSGNPNVEFRGGISRGNYDWNGGWNTGTGTWTFSTNNQTFQGPEGYIANCTCKFIVSGSITVTFTNGARTTFADKIDGTVAGSTWINQGRMRFIGTEITPMETGVFDYLTSTSSYLAYEYNGNLTIPYTSYQGFVVAGTGTKTLSGNTSIAQNFEFNDNVTHNLECGIYDFSVTGISGVNGVISKTDAGNILFVGNLLWGGTSGTGNQGGFNLTGNPTLEFRGGITYGTYGMNAATNTGIGQITFSTNNQTAQLGRNSGANITLNNPILISGAIVVTLNNSITNTLLAGSINGDDISSTLRIAANATTRYNSPTQPMITGVLDTSTNLNTWIYGNSNQDIKGGTYRNLTFNGGGTKTLQGNVSVQNTYTLTAPATVNLNGFALTNP